MRTRAYYCHNCCISSDPPQAGQEAMIVFIVIFQYISLVLFCWFMFVHLNYLYLLIYRAASPQQGWILPCFPAGCSRGLIKPVRPGRSHWFPAHYDREKCGGGWLVITFHGGHSVKGLHTALPPGLTLPARNCRPAIFVGKMVETV